MANNHLGKITFETRGSLTLGHFRAMANPCVIIIEHDDRQAVEQAMQRMAAEVWRLEQKYSRYSADSMLTAINNANGKPVAIDAETFHLLSLSDVLWQESQGVFDISSGIFRTLWTFDASQELPSQTDIDAVLGSVDWKRIRYDQKQIVLPQGMQIDFGGIGKEYAADCCAALAPTELGNHVLVNLGGDIVAKGPRADSSPWQVGIEHKSGEGAVWKTLPLSGGAVATSGDVYKSVVIDGKRYGHIISALTGYPVPDSVSTVTVAAPNCTEAGILSTLAILQGADAGSFLKGCERPFWVQE